MNKLMTVTSILAKILDVKKKELLDITELYFFHGSTVLDLNNGATPTVYLSNEHTGKFLRKIEKKYGVFFPGNESSNFINILGTVKAIDCKIRDNKAQAKAEKDKIPDFVFTKHIETIRISNEATMINVIGSGAVSLLPNFWTDFDKWYSSNRKNIQKVVKAYKKEFKKAAKSKKPIKDDAPISEAA